VCDTTEIAEAAWFRRDELPPIPPAISIARRLIDDWVFQR
jgi:NAD+ diphosphatase